MTLLYFAFNLFSTWMVMKFSGSKLSFLISVIGVQHVILPVQSFPVQYIITLGPRQNDRYFTDIFTCIFLNENVRILINISLQFVPTGQINNIPALVQIMTLSRSGDKPLSEPIVLVYWRIYTSLGLNELSHKHLKTHGCVLVEAPGHQYPQG